MDILTKLLEEKQTTIEMLKARIVNLENTLSRQRACISLAKGILFQGGCILEDELPAELKGEDFGIAYEYSKIDGARVYPKLVVDLLMKGGE